MSSDFRKAVIDAAGRSDVHQAVANLYREVQAEVDQRRPVCVISGKCCRFEEYGHRLFVTTIEMAAFVHSTKPMAPEWDGKGCPYQKNKLCSVHSVRPFGCRMFFCDATSTEWQNGQYERFHNDLKRLHESLGVPYFYSEWRQALRECLLLQEDNL